MPRHAKVQEMLDRYEQMIDQLAQLQVSWEKVDNEAANRIRHDTWSLCMRLWNRREWYDARFSDSTVQRCVALRRYATVGGEEALSRVSEILAAPDLPVGVASAAKKAANRLKARYSDDLLDRLTERLTELWHGPELDNYQGHVCASVTDANRRTLTPHKNGALPAGPGDSCHLNVRLQANEPRGRLFEPVAIRDGREAREVTFEVSLESDSVKFKPQRQNVTVVGDKQSPPAKFSLTMPKTAGAHKIWIELYQKEQIIQTLCIRFALKGK